MSDGVLEEAGNLTRDNVLSLEDRSVLESIQEDPRDLKLIASTFNRALADVQTFTGRSFDCFPKLVVTDRIGGYDGEEPEGMPAGYSVMDHAVAFSIHAPEYDKDSANSGWTEDEGDYLYSLAVEEATHALQNEQLGNTGYLAKGRKIISDRVPFVTSVLPEFEAEGFGDFTSDRLGNFSWEQYRVDNLREVWETPTEELMREAGFDPEDQASRRVFESRITDESSRQIEALTGKAYYEALNSQEGFDGAIDEAMTRSPNDIEYVLSVIEEAGTQPGMYNEIVRPYWNDERIKW